MHATTLFLLSLGISALLPLAALRWLQPLLLRVLQGLCDADGSAEFWLRTTQVLAVTGSLVLLLSFGQFEAGIDTVDALRRTLWLSLAATFVSVALVSRNVWRRIPGITTTDKVVS
jgi:hypothetical protein